MRGKCKKPCRLRPGPDKMIAGKMSERRTALLRIVSTFLGVSVLCYAGIQIFSPSASRTLSEPMLLAPGVHASASFSGGPTWEAAGISVSVGLAVLLVWRLAVLVGSPRSPLRGIRKLRRAQAGQAITEFVIVFWALMMVVMGVAQMSLMYNAKNVTLYAAYAAARSAIVWIPMETDEPSHEMTLTTGNDKFSNIKNSAVIACVPISRRASHVMMGLPLVGGLVQDVVNAITQMLAVVPGAVQVLDYADRFAYAYFCTNVKFVRINGNNTTDVATLGDTHNFLPHEDISVQVTHCFHLNIPLAAQLVDKMGTLPPEFMLLEFAPGNYTAINAVCTLTLETP